MQIHLSVALFAHSADLQEGLRRRIERMLVRYRQHLQKVSLCLRAMDGPKGRAVTTCRIVIRLDDGRQVIAEARDPDFDRAVGLAVVRARLALGQRLNRRLSRGAKAPPACAPAHCESGPATPYRLVKEGASDDDP